MCNPTAIIGTQAAAGAASTVGAYYAASGQRSALRSQARLADINAGLAEMDARQAMIQGERAEQAQRIQTANLKGRQRATMGGSGIALDSQSAQQILNSTDILGEIDALTIEQNAVRAAWGHRMQAANARNQARMARATASGISPAMAGATSLLGTATSVASNYYALDRSGAFDEPQGFDYNAAAQGFSMPTLGGSFAPGETAGLPDGVWRDLFRGRFG